jgi:hypothetical protein
MQFLARTPLTTLRAFGSMPGWDCANGCGQRTFRRPPFNQCEKCRPACRGRKKAALPLPQAAVRILRRLRKKTSMTIASSASMKQSRDDDQNRNQTLRSMARPVATPSSTSSLPLAVSSSSSSSSSSSEVATVTTSTSLPSKGSAATLASSLLRAAPSESASSSAVRRRAVEILAETPGVHDLSSRQFCQLAANAHRLMDLVDEASSCLQPSDGVAAALMVLALGFETRELPSTKKREVKGSDEGSDQEEESPLIKNLTLVPGAPFAMCQLLTYIGGRRCIAL